MENIQALPKKIVDSYRENYFDEEINNLSNYDLIYEELTQDENHILESLMDILKTPETFSDFVDLIDNKFIDEPVTVPGSWKHKFNIYLFKTLEEIDSSECITSNILSNMIRSKGGLSFGHL